MGVPGFFLWLWKKYKKNNFVFNKQIEDEILLNKINNIDYLLIDANCLIHPVCFQVLAENNSLTDKDKLENKMIHAVLEYIDKLIQYTSPKKGIYLAIDGVAPIAKIKQQRTRRFKSVHDKILWNNIKKKHNKEIPNEWNNSAITPGTQFMEKLHYKILEWCQKKDFEVLYSSCKTPSEGEHKLLQFVRNNQKDNIHYSYIIYGLDADLIFLALSTNEPDMFLLRESEHLDKSSGEELNFVSIDIMRESIISTLEDIMNNQDLLTEGNIQEEDKVLKVIPEKVKDNIINDFIFICYLLGNDFLPHIPSLNIYTNGIDILLNKYIEVVLTDNFKNFIIKRGKKISINNKIFLKLISYLGSEEEEVLKNSYLSKKRYYKCDSTDPYNIEVHRIENLYFKIDDPIELGSDESKLWKKRYYKYYFNIDDSEYNDYVNNIVNEYLIGLKWIAEYYFDKCPSWDWYYKYDYPPFLEDIAEYLDKNKKFNFKSNFKLGSPLKPFNQLLLVLPPQSSFLLPKKLQKITSNPRSSVAYLYPTGFRQDFLNKKKYWMGQPILPPLDIPLIKKTYYKYENSVDSKEKNRNKALKVFEFK